MCSSQSLRAETLSVSSNAPSPYSLPPYPQSWSQTSVLGSPPTSRTPGLSSASGSRKRKRVDDTDEPNQQRYDSTILPLQHSNHDGSYVSACYLLESASLAPPITVVTLSELDMANIIKNEILRRNLNFETRAQFWPNYNTELGRLRKAEASKYWAAIKIEVTLYMQPWDSHRKSRESPLPGSTFPPRLPPMLAEVKKILKTLLREEKAAVVDEILDVNLVMQQLQKNVCDLVKLSDWLATMLKSSCSPQRDLEVDSATDTLKRAAENGDPAQIVDGLENLFSVFETMKLDAANHQIQFLRGMLIDNTIEFEQSRFVNRLERGMEVAEARSWFARCCRGSLPAPRDGDLETCMDNTIDYGPNLVGRAIVESVVAPGNTLPITFAFDEDRLAELRHDFRLFNHHTTVLDVATRLLEEGWPHTLPQSKVVETISRIQQLIYSVIEPPSHVDITLEMYRAIHESRDRSCHAIVGPKLMRSIQDRFSTALAEETVQLRRLCDQLHDQVDREIRVIANATPLQIHELYTPTWRPQGPESTLSPKNMAQRIAHISVLHWRVWGPILHQYPQQERSAWLAAQSPEPPSWTMPPSDESLAIEQLHA